MTKEERLKVYKTATELWGLIAQYDQCIEEMGELIVAINKYKRKCLHGEYRNNQKIEEDLVEEIADVSICIEQLIGFMGEKRVDMVKNKKMAKFCEEIDEVTELRKKSNKAK